MVSLSTVGWDAHGWTDLSDHPYQTWEILGPTKHFWWVWASLAGVWQESQSQKGAFLLLGFSQRQKQRKALPAQSHHSLIQHRRSLVPTLHPSLCRLQCWRKVWCFFVRKIPSFPYPSSWRSCFSTISFPGSLFLSVHLAPMRSKPVAAALGQGQPEAAASQPELIKGVWEQRGRDEQRAALARSSFNSAMVNAGYCTWDQIFPCEVWHNCEGRGL